MRQILLILCLVGIQVSSTALQAQDSTAIVETKSHNIFKGLFQSVWARLKSLNPSSSESANSAVIYTAGIRGAESTDTLLKPYWKADLTRDEKFQAELEHYGRAQLKMDRGELEAAVSSFDGFLDDFAQSELRPNALFGKSISLAGLGKNEQSLAAMRQFLDEHPNHPLQGDARQVIDELQ